MYPKTPGYFSDLSSSLCCKSYCFFLKLLVVFPIPFSLLHFTPPKVLRLYCNLSFRCVRYFGGSSDSSKVFLVSNKHILTPKSIEKEEQNKEAKATVLLNKEEKGEVEIKKIEVILRDKDGKDLWKGHTNPNIDVACLDFTSFISENRTVIQGLKIGFISEDRFATKEILEKYYVSIGDQIIILGYPLNLVEGGHSIPIARGGPIISWPTT